MPVYISDNKSGMYNLCHLRVPLGFYFHFKGHTPEVDRSRTQVGPMFWGATEIEKWNYSKSTERVDVDHTWLTCYPCFSAINNYQLWNIQKIYEYLFIYLQNLCQHRQAKCLFLNALKMFLTEISKVKMRSLQWTILSLHKSKCKPIYLGEKTSSKQLYICIEYIVYLVCGMYNKKYNYIMYSWGICRVF